MLGHIFGGVIVCEATILSHALDQRLISQLLLSYGHKRASNKQIIIGAVTVLRRF